MRKVILALALLLGGLVDGQSIGVYTANKIVGGNLPSACNGGPPADIWIDTTVSPPLAYICGPSNTWNTLGTGASVAWGDITGTPTTLSGYGITDACGIAGGAACTMVGQIKVATSTTGGAGLNNAGGVSPTTCVDGDLWYRAADTHWWSCPGGTATQIPWSSELSTYPAGNGILAKTGAGPPVTLAARTITGTASYIGVTNGDGVSADPVITVAAGPIRTRVCEVYVYGSGAAGVLQDADDVANVCTNGSGVTETITHYGCFVSSITGTPTATPVLGDGSTAIVTGAVSCTATVNTLAMGTISGTPTLTPITLSSGACASGSCTINANITTAGGTATYIKHVFVLTK